MGIRHLVCAGAIPGRPLPGAGRALHLFPLVAKQRVEIAVVPGYRGRCPGAFDATGDGIAALAAAKTAAPALALLLNGGAFRFRAHVRRVAGAVRLAEGMTTGDERYRLLVVHRHAGKGFAYVASRSNRIRGAVGPLRIDVDKTHLHGAERCVQLPVASVAGVSQPFVLNTPVDVSFRLPHVRPPAGEAKCLASH